VTIAEVVFYLLALVAVIGGIGVVVLPNIVHAALALTLALLASAGFYILLSSEFLALVQILVYGGGVATIILFGLMLVRGRELPEVGPGNQWPIGLAASLVLMFALLTAVVGSDWPRQTGEVTMVSMETLASALFRDWLLPFEIASIVLTVALIGAIVISRQEEGEA